MRTSLSDKISLGIMYALILLFVAFCIYPLLLVLAVSFSKENNVMTYGYALIPKAFSLDAYSYVFNSLGNKLLRGYSVTLFVTVMGTALSVFATSTYAYVASVRGFRFSNLFSFLAYIPMVFSAGILPWYILLTKYYHLMNNISALIVPMTINLFYFFLLRNFFNAVPAEMAEAAKIDGAGHMTILFRVYFPIARVGIITIGLFYALTYWNDFYLALMFITEPKIYPLQFYLYTVLANLDFLNSHGGTAMGNSVKAPLETTKMALTTITIGPIIVLYPFMQRFFVKGVVVGAVKG
ncbi:carbohydrate ABC transporter permease [Cohnella soli]|uniref:Carbohydrate ABC transporter permease n=1 Tax=Cohnella soli TaxID=425005 RepID=A0ABW0HQ97_9BACL